jgi:hypothetical protein
LARARAVGAVVIHLENDGPAGAVDQPGTPGWELYLPVYVLPHDAHATYDIPAAPDISDVVLPAVASRVAERALGV